MSPRSQGREGQRGHGPPSWWPEGEAWPPRGRPEHGRALRRRFAGMIAVVVVLIIIAFAIFNHAQGNWDNNWGPSEGENGPPGKFFWRPFALIIIGAIVFFVIRKIGRTFAPLANVIDAAERVAEGDYSVHLEPNGPPEVQSMVGAFNTMTARLKANEEQRTHLLSDIAHELRTPLAVVQGTIEGMLDEVYPSDRDHLASLLDQTRLIARLLNDLQTVATAEAGVLTLHRTVTGLADLIQDVITSFTPVATRHGIALGSVGAREVTIDIDPIRIRQVLDNLVTNALRYTPEGGSVTIGVQPGSGGIEIKVADTGRGMSPHDAERMFERFGSGLGLAIAKGLVEAHGGTISATSIVGTGTTVTISLPRS